MATDTPTGFAASLRRTQRAGFAIVAVLVVVLGGWAATTDISGAVVGSGHIVVRSNAKKVQHLEGGIVRELRVANGDRVSAGDVIVRLDPSEARARLAIIGSQLAEVEMELARLEAERDGRPALQVPADLEGWMPAADLARIAESQQKLLESRLDGLTGKKRQLAEQVKQIGNQITGLEAQLDGRKRQSRIAGEELKTMRDLLDKQLVQVTRVLALEREQADIDGDTGRLVAEIAKLKGAIGEVELKSIQVDDDWRTDILAAIADARTKAAALREQRLAAQDRIERIDIVAPQSGFVHELAVHTVGGVVGAGETLMLIVPESEPMVLRARIRPQDMDAVWVGQPVRVRVLSFNQRTSQDIAGSVVTAGADISVDPQTRQSYLEVDIVLDQSGTTGTTAKEHVRPGMPAEAFIQTGDRTALSYLLKPLTEQVGKAFRE